MSAEDALDEEADVMDAAWDRRMADALGVHDDLAAEEDAADAIVWTVVDVIRVVNGLPPTPEFV